MIKRILLMTVTAFGTTVAASSGSLAFCGVVSASATGSSREAAISRANAKGLAETRRLDRKYAGAVRYQPAVSTCTDRRPVSCRITQKFCVN